MTVRKIHIEGEAELYDAIHDLSMSDNIKEAAYGRCLKYLIPSTDSFIVAERERDTSPQDILHALIQATVQVVAASVQCFAVPGHAKVLMGLIKQQYNFVLDMHKEEMGSIDEEQKTERQELDQLIKIGTELINQRKQKGQQE